MTETFQELLASGSFLFQISETERFDKLKLHSSWVAPVLDPDNLMGWRSRMTSCAEHLVFAQMIDMQTGEVKLKLREAHFCRVRLCPVCQWRRALRWRAEFSGHVKKLDDQGLLDGKRWMMITLTVRNCHVTELRKTLQSMSKAWTRLIKTVDRSFPVHGFVRAMEAGYAMNQYPALNVHPHYHALLLMDKDFALGSWELLPLWQKAMRDESISQVEIHPIIPKGNEAAENSIHYAANEVLKYSLKPLVALDAPVGWLSIYAQEVIKLRFLGVGGLIKGAFSRKEGEESDNDLIFTGEEKEALGDNEALKLNYRYHKEFNHYVQA